MIVKPACKTVRTWASAIRHFSRKRSVAGMPAAVRRAASVVHDTGTYRSHVNGHVRPSARSALDTATAIADLAQRAAVLALHADGVGPLLREAGVVEGQDPGADGHDRAQLRPHPRRVPRRVCDEVLERLIVLRIPEPPMHRLHGLPLAVVEQAVDVLAGGRALGPSTEARTEPVQVLTQALQQRPCRPCGHARSVQTPARQYKRYLSTQRGRTAINLTK